MNLPKPELAVVEIAKLRDYCLNPDHLRGRHKARASGDRNDAGSRCGGNNASGRAGDHAVAVDDNVAGIADIGNLRVDGLASRRGDIAGAVDRDKPASRRALRRENAAGAAGDPVVGDRDIARAGDSGRNAGRAERRVDDRRIAVAGDELIGVNRGEDHALCAACEGDLDLACAGLRDAESANEADAG